MLKATAKSNVSLKANSHESDSVHCSFNTRHEILIFQYYVKNLDKVDRFARAMTECQKSESLLSFFSWYLYILDILILTDDREVKSSINELRNHFSWTQLKDIVMNIEDDSDHVSMILTRVSYLKSLVCKIITKRLFLMMLFSKAFHWAQLRRARRICKYACWRSEVADRWCSRLHFLFQVKLLWISVV